MNIKFCKREVYAIAILILYIFSTLWYIIASNNSIEVLPIAKINEDSLLYKINHTRIDGLKSDISVFSSSTPILKYRSNEFILNHSGRRSLWLFGVILQNNSAIKLKVNNRSYELNNDISRGTDLHIIELHELGLIDVDNSATALEINANNVSINKPFLAVSFLATAPEDMTEQELLSCLHVVGSFHESDIITIVTIFVISLLVIRLFIKNINLIRNRDIIFFIITILTTTVLAFAIHINTGKHVFENSGYDNRVGLDKYLSDYKNKTFEYLIRNVVSKFPNRLVEDSVPDSIKRYSDSIDTEVYFSHRSMDTNMVSSHIFGGLLKVIQQLSIYNFIVINVMLLSIFLCILLFNFKKKKSSLYFVSIFIIFLISAAFSLRLSEGFDEFFINLRHAYILYTNGIYSINSSKFTEATVDFLPLILTTGLRYLGVNLVDGLIFISLIGNLILAYAAFLYFSLFIKNRIISVISCFLIVLYPGVIWVGASGFTAVFFTSIILLSSYFYLFTKKDWLALILLGSITLIRTEGIMFAVVIFLVKFIFDLIIEIFNKFDYSKLILRYLKDLFVIVTPFVLSCIIRLHYFGALLPNPVTFKNTNFDRSFLSLGISSFSENISSHDFHIIIFISFILLLIKITFYDKDFRLRSSYTLLFLLNILIFLASLTYYLGGGDWFPYYWNRYGLPFDIVLLITFTILIINFFKQSLGKLYKIGIIAYIILLAYIYIGTVQFRSGNVYGKTVDSLVDSDSKWKRVDSLASLGDFLREVTPRNAIIASPEEATIMYYSKRDMLGLLGVSNPDMLKMPFQSLNVWGDILYRRRAYQTIYYRRPDIIALYEPFYLKNYNPSNISLEIISTDLKNYIFNQDMVDCAYFRVGAYSSLPMLGYQHFTIVYTNILYSIFVNKNIVNQFRLALNAQGLNLIGSIKINYQIRKDLVDRFLPYSPELITHKTK